MREVLEQNKQFKTVIVTEDDRLYAHTTNFDDVALDRNQQIRNENLLAKAKLSLHENEDIRFVISCPSVVQWNTFKMKHFDTYQLIVSRDEAERMRGCKQLQILEPAWVVQERL